MTKEQRRLYCSADGSETIQYKNARTKLNNAIKVTKAKLYKKICPVLYNAIWKRSYQIVAKGLGKIAIKPLKDKSTIESIKTGCTRTTVH